ncbi:MAG: hypothetical protein JW720_00735, partial [Sedimentisphaerales bacterium]|nr:hypothetical protein [Sedimentisphaerales bacterium]
GSQLPAQQHWPVGQLLAKGQSALKSSQTLKLRLPPKLVYEVSELLYNGYSSTGEYTQLTTGWKDKVKGTAKEYGVPEECWIFKDIKGPEFEKLHPFMSLAEARELNEASESEIRELVKVKKRSGKIENLLADKSSVLHYLSRLTPRLYRIYVLGIDDTKAASITEKIRDWLRPAS